MKTFKTLFLTTFVILGLGFLETTIAQVNLQNGLVAYYPFNGNANDESGNGKNGTVNGATLTNDRSGNANSAYSFNGVNGFITLPDPVSLNIYQNDFTVCSWIKIYNFRYGPCYGYDDHTILGSPGLSQQNQQLCLFIRNQYPFFSFYANDMTANEKIEADKTYFIVFRYNKTNNEMSLFLNGVLAKSETGHGPFSGQAEVYIGKLGECHFFNGIIDDFRIYNRPLNEAEILELYAPTGISEFVEGDILIYPNPANDKLTITGIESPTVANIYNLNGLLLQTNKLTNQTNQVSLNNLAVGAYIIKLTANKEIAVKRFVKE